MASGRCGVVERFKHQLKEHFLKESHAEDIKLLPNHWRHTSMSQAPKASESESMGRDSWCFPVLLHLSVMNSSSLSV